MKLVKIVGEIWVTKDNIVKETKTKNTVKQTIKRETKRHLVFECGHTRAVSDMTSSAAKAKSVDCFQCRMGP